MINNDPDLVELERHLTRLKEFQKKTLPSDAKEKLDDEIAFLERKLNGNND